MSQEERAKLFKRLVGLGICEDDAEDLLQDALVDAFEYLRQEHPDAAPEAIESLLTDAFLEQILKCRVADFFRARKRELQFIHEYIAHCQLQSPDENEWWTFQAAYEVLNHLPKCWQRVVGWRAQGYSWQEIATLTGRPIGTLAPGLKRVINAVCKDLGYFRKKNFIAAPPLAVYVACPSFATFAARYCHKRVHS